ncbi:MAG: hypothetical protein M0R70_05075, partial [Nitrospirae bacterium]|nr:hypothetical protein [Nitrospirota bacterium]
LPAHGDHVLFCHNALLLTLGIVTGNRTFLFWRIRTLSFWDYKKKVTTQVKSGQNLLAAKERKDRREN